MYIEIYVVDTNQVFQVARNLIQVLVFQMFRWMLPKKDLSIACEQGGVQMYALKGDL